MPLTRKTPKPDILRDRYGLTCNPFRVGDMYRPDNPGRYIPEMYGARHGDFLQKFFVQPLERDQRQVIGAVWSTRAGDNEGRGHGKSMLMCEESKRVNADFGASILAATDVTDDAIADNPFLATYTTFAESLNIKTFPAALLEGIAFAAACQHGATNVHLELRGRIIQRLGLDGPYASEGIKSALAAKLFGYKNLKLQLTSRQLSGFIDALCGDDTEVLGHYIRERIGPRVRAALGFHFVHVFNAFAALGGIVHVVNFVDQIENFAKFTRQQDRDVRILREAMCEISPTADMASFVFQMHPNALRVLEPIWQAEHLPSLDYAAPVNRSRVVDLTGLSSMSHAVQVTALLLKDLRPVGFKPPLPTHPFPPDVLEMVRRAIDGNPRRFLEVLCTIMDHGIVEGREVIDTTFVQPLLDVTAGEYVAEIDDDDDDDDLSNPLQ
jgi:hypothetical protein